MADSLSNGWNQTRQNLAEGWHAFGDRATQALARFSPAHRAVEFSGDQVAWQSSRRGLVGADVRLRDDEIHLRLEIPRREREDFSISAENRDVLRVCGEKQVQREETSGHYSLLESACRHFESAIRLPADVDEGRARAIYRKLRVVLPKA